MDYKPVFKELWKVVSGNIKVMKDGLANAKTNELSKIQISSRITELTKEHPQMYSSMQ